MAWLKLLYLCHSAKTEVGCFGISHPDDLLYVSDIQTVRQHCTTVSVEFDDEAVADFFDEQVEQGRKPEQFARTWIHTHPGDSPEPSGLDEETFTRVFGRCNWAAMFILARGGANYCRLQVNGSAAGDAAANVKLANVIPVRVDYALLPQALAELDVTAWQKELDANVLTAQTVSRCCWNPLDELEIEDALLEQLDELDPADEMLFDAIDEAEMQVGEHVGGQVGVDHAG